MSVACAGISLWGNLGAKSVQSQNYDIILATAETYDDYYSAMIIDPSRTEAYEQLSANLISDFELSKEEGQVFLKLLAGLEQKNRKGFSERFDVLNDMKKSNPSGYQDICYLIGESFLFYYDVNEERDRYNYAAMWFKEAVEKYPIAEIYCDISQCLNLTNQYNGAKIKQTGKMYEEYEKLWNKLQELNEKASVFDSIDSKLQVWNEINHMIYSKAAPFLEVTEAEQLIELLNRISTEAGKIDKSVIQEDIKKLQSNIAETVRKIETAK